jgi:hypothetical protein
MIRTFTAAEVSSAYRVPLGTVYRLASTDGWRRSTDGKWPVLYNGFDVEVTMERWHDLDTLSVIGRMYLDALDEDPENEYLTLPAALMVQDVREAVERQERRRAERGSLTP